MPVCGCPCLRAPPHGRCRAPRCRMAPPHARPRLSFLWHCQATELRASPPPSTAQMAPTQLAYRTLRARTNGQVRKASRPAGWLTGSSLPPSLPRSLPAPPAPVCAAAPPHRLPCADGVSGGSNATPLVSCQIIADDSLVRCPRRLYDDHSTQSAADRINHSARLEYAAGPRYASLLTPPPRVDPARSRG